MSNHYLTSKSNSAAKPELLLFNLKPEDIDLYTCICQLEDPIFPSAANNYAVCAMHLGQVKTAVALLESIVQQNPFEHLVDPIVFNLCTMYDISYSANVSEVKKKCLRAVADRYCIKDTELSAKSFRPPMN
jgi:hypothetical protein